MSNSVRRDKKLKSSGLSITLWLFLFALIYTPAIAIDYDADKTVKEEAPVFADLQNPKVAKEYIVFSTRYGPLLFALYPDVAPKHVDHVLKLVRAGLYDSTEFFRIVPNFLVQVSQVDNRAIPLTQAQKQMISTVEAEFSQVKHTKGKLSMARWENDVNSGSSSFCIMVADAPHMDGSYTVFGHLASGGSVINKMLAAGRNPDESPKEHISVKRAYVINDIVTFYAQYPFDSPDRIDPTVAALDVAHMNPKDNPLINLVAILVIVIICTGLLGFFLFDKISKNRLLSLLLVNVLIAGFILLILFVPIGHEHPWVAAVLFLGMFGLFQLMSRFEKNR